MGSQTTSGGFLQQLSSTGDALAFLADPATIGEFAETISVRVVLRCVFCGRLLLIVLGGERMVSPCRRGGEGDGGDDDVPENAAHFTPSLLPDRAASLTSFR